MHPPATYRSLTWSLLHGGEDGRMSGCLSSSLWHFALLFSVYCAKVSDVKLYSRWLLLYICEVSVYATMLS